VGVHSIFWDLKEDNGQEVEVGLQLWVRLYRGVTPIDSLSIQVVD
jgi:hypothetical protein